MTARAGGRGVGAPDLQNSSSEPIFNSSKTEEKLGGLWTRGFIFWTRVLAPDIYMELNAVKLNCLLTTARERLSISMLFTH